MEGQMGSQKPEMRSGLEAVTKRCMCWGKEGRPAAHRSEANKKARLVEGKFALFQRLACAREGGRCLSKGKPPPSNPDKQQVRESFYRQRVWQGRGEGWGRAGGSMKQQHRPPKQCSPIGLQWHD